MEYDRGADMLAEALPIALAGALYPVALVTVVAMLGGPDPMHRAVAFLLGGLLISLAGFAVVVAIASSLHITPHHHPAIAAVIKTALGVVLLLLALRSATRHRRSAPSRAHSPGAEERKTGSVWRAFIAGMVIYIPGVFLIACAKTVADADARWWATALVSVVCVVILLSIVEVPILAFAISPGTVQPALERAVAASRAHSYPIVMAIEMLAGAYLIAVGLSTLL